MLEVVKRASGHYSKPKSSENPTHIIFDVGECREYYDNIIKDKQAAFDEQIGEALGEAWQYKKMAEKYQNLNRNLVRAVVGKANAQRGMFPQKQYNGYVMLYAEQYEYRFDDYERFLPCFRVHMQTPYQMTFDFPSMKILTNSDLLKFKDDIGVQIIYDDLQDYIVTENIDIEEFWKRSDNFIFRVRHKLNGQRGFWEIEYLTRHMVTIPPGMIPKNNRRPKSPPKKQG